MAFWAVLLLGNLFYLGGCASAYPATPQAPGVTFDYTTKVFRPANALGSNIVAGANITIDASTNGPLTLNARSDAMYPTLAICTGITPPDYNGSNAYLSVTHPDVYYNPAGWNGYPYWMAITPFPDQDRENPCVFASYNGQDWIDFGNNPISPYSEATANGYGFHADTDICVQSNGLMAVYYIAVRSNPTNRLAIVVKTSADGRTWSARREVASHGSGIADNIEGLSPSVVVEPDGTLVMFHCGYTNSTTQLMGFRVSTDHGTNWSGVTNCPILTNRMGWPRPWHMDVTKAGSTYYALAKHTTTTSDYKLFMGRSTNRTDWKWDNVPAFHYRTGITNFDYQGVYRSTFVVKSLFPLRWDVWVSGVPRYGLGSTVPGTPGSSDQPWRVGYYRDITLPSYFQPEDVSAIIPPLSTATTSNTVTLWPTSNGFLASRFTVKEPRTVRYLNYRVDYVPSAACSNEVGIVRLAPGAATSSGAVVETIATSGIYQIVSSQNMHVDLGEVRLGPGEYATFIWSNTNTWYMPLNPSLNSNPWAQSAQLGLAGSGYLATNNFATWPGQMSWTFGGNAYAIGVTLTAE